jgi:beta-N-acetylhexosaminidase
MKDRQITTYLCTYDLTSPPLDALVRVLFGKLKATGLPPTSRQTSLKSSIQRQLWLVEKFDFARDVTSLQEMFDQVRLAASNTFSDPEAQYPSYCFEAAHYQNHYSPLFETEHYIVRNSSTQKLYGFCATYYSLSLSRGIVAAIVVSTSHRGKGIGFSLHQHALQNLERRHGLDTVQFGSELPVVFPGIPNRLSSYQLGLRSWVRNRYVLPRSKALKPCFFLVSS